MNQVLMAVPDTVNVTRALASTITVVVVIPMGCSQGVGSLEQLRLSHWTNKTLTGSRRNCCKII